MLDFNVHMPVTIVESKNRVKSGMKWPFSVTHMSPRPFHPCEAGRLPSSPNPVPWELDMTRKESPSGAYQSSSTQNQAWVSESRLTNTSSFGIICDDGWSPPLVSNPAGLHISGHHITQWGSQLSVSSACPWMVGLSVVRILTWQSLWI